MSGGLSLPAVDPHLAAAIARGDAALAPTLPAPPLAPAPAPATPPGDDTVRTDFMAARRQAPQSAAQARLDALVATPANTPTPAPAVAPGGANPQPGADGVATVHVTAPAPAPGAPVSIGQRLVNAAKAVGSDVWTGVSQAPQEIGNGALDVVNGLSQFAGDLAKWGDAHGLPDAYVQLFDAHGNWSPQIYTPAQYQASAAAGQTGVFRVPTIGTMPSITGSLIRGITSLALPEGKLAALGGGGALAHLAATFATGAVTTDPNAPRLSNLLDKVAPNFLASWLKATPGQEGPLLARLKSGLEFAGEGAALGGVIKALVAAKGAIGAAAGAAGDETGATAGEAAAGQPSGGAAGAGEPAVAEGAPAGNSEASGAEAGAAGTDDAAPAAESDATGGVGAPSAEPASGPDAVRAALQSATPAPDAAAASGAPAAGVDQNVAAGAAAGPPGAAQGEAPDLIPIGQRAAPQVSISPDIAQAAQAYLDGKPGPNPVKVNLAYIGSGEDIQNVLEQVSRLIPANPVQGHEATALAADALGLSSGDLLAGYKGEQLNAAQLVATKMVLESSAQQVVDLAAAATDPATGSPLARAQALRAVSTHVALQQYFENARNEAGRTLDALKVIARHNGGAGDAVKTLIGAMEGSAGTGSSQEFLEKIAGLKDPLKVSRLIAQSQRGGRDWGLVVFYNALLSNPFTVMKKVVSDGSNAVWETGARYTAEKFGAGGVSPGETWSLMSGYSHGFGDALAAGWRAMKAGESLFHPEARTLEGLGPRVSLLAEGTPAAFDPEKPILSALQYLRAALPTSWMAGADDFGKMLHYRAQLSALAFREGVNRGLSGDDLATFRAQVLDSPPEAMRADAWAYAQRNTFTDPLTGLNKKIQDAVDGASIPMVGTDYRLPVGRIILPFVRVPANILAWSYRNTALRFVLPTDAMKAEMAAGGATRDLAVARAGLGSMVALGAGGLVLSGNLTGGGPTNPRLRAAWRAAGNEPYSLRIGGTWYGYNHLEPIGTLLGAIADTYDVMHFADDRDSSTVAASLIFGLGSAMLSKSYLMGMSRFFDALHAPDTDGSYFVNGLLSSIAAPPGVSALANAIDPQIKAHYGLLATIESRLPGVKEGLPAQHTLWGDPISYEQAYAPLGLSGTGVARMFPLVPEGAASAEPVDRFVWENRQYFTDSSGHFTVDRPGRTQPFGTGGGGDVPIRLDPQEYSRFQVLAGNGIKDGEGLGAKDALNALVTGRYPDPDVQDQWNNAAPAAQALMVRRLINASRRAARGQLLREFPQLQDAVLAQATARRQQLLGAPAGGAAPAPSGGAPRMPQLAGGSP